MSSSSWCVIGCGMPEYELPKSFWISYGFCPARARRAAITSASGLPASGKGVIGPEVSGNRPAGLSNSAVATACSLLQPSGGHESVSRQGCQLVSAGGTSCLRLSDRRYEEILLTCRNRKQSGGGSTLLISILNLSSSDLPLMNGRNISVPQHLEQACFHHIRGASIRFQDMQPGAKFGLNKTL